ncbi:GNAT family N-acetyltransferase [Alkalihalobacillus sp. TS-13]|uniref:GNAT family N-acetyltransferase n=1 Tax=Alkalihalobacillus sp. TS-13 TaxID=2842455 RepID=UPI001C876C88|nr:GNAT family N-acetyltransferase [Alkalihalobacillus sp. TS-13]
MLKKRDLNECHVLYELMADPAVFPFVRHKAGSVEEFIFLTKQTLEAEENGELISRTILDEWGNPIGTINLFDIQENCGFLGTWIGKPYHGKGYNQLAKELFFTELFFEKDIQTIFMRIRKTNPRSERAALKIPYVSLANETRPDIYQQLNAVEDVYNLFQIERDTYYMYTARHSSLVEEAMEA